MTEEVSNSGEAPKKKRRKRSVETQAEAQPEMKSQVKTHDTQLVARAMVQKKMEDRAKAITSGMRTNMSPRYNPLAVHGGNPDNLHRRWVRKGDNVAARKDMGYREYRDENGKKRETHDLLLMECTRENAAEQIADAAIASKERIRSTFDAYKEKVERLSGGSLIGEVKGESELVSLEKPVKDSYS